MGLLEKTRKNNLGHSLGLLQAIHGQEERNVR
jgi:hypothetical protein